MHAPEEYPEMVVLSRATEWAWSRDPRAFSAGLVPETKVGVPVTCQTAACNHVIVQIEFKWLADPKELAMESQKRKAGPNLSLQPLNPTRLEYTRIVLRKSRTGTDSSWDKRSTTSRER